MKTKRWLAVLSFLFSLGAAAPAYAQLLQYTLSSELMKAGCRYDVDGDCLDDMMESQLAQAAAPAYFYDEDEDCSWRQQARFARKDHFQVRPQSPAMSQWPGAQFLKRVRVTYFLLHPHDCQDYVVTGGHQGDGEKVEFTLMSVDGRTWFLETSRYWHHHTPWDRFSGTTLANIARSIGSTSPVVAADEDGHGSWPGRAHDSQDCAGSEDSFSNDCFDGNMEDAFHGGRFEIVGTSRNIGGPSPERWNASLLNVNGDTASELFDVGFGFNEEFWSGGIARFCGWQCSSRDSNGDCRVSADGEKGCSDGLQTKTDRDLWPLLPLTPDTTADGTLLRNWQDGAIYVIEGGAKFWIPSFDWFPRLGLHESRVREVGPDDVAVFPTNVPRDGTLLHNADDGRVYVVHGGAKLYIASPDQFTKLGYSWSEVRTVPTNAFAGIPDVPRDGTLFTTETSNGGVYVMGGGARFGIPDAGYFERAGYDWAKVKPVPSTAVAAFPFAPSGHVENVGTDGWIGGWAFDADVPGQQLSVHIYLDGPAGVGRFVTSVPTSVYRPDVNSYFASVGLTGNHGFAYQMPASYRDGLSHQVFVYAIDNGGRFNPWLDRYGYSITWR